MRTKPTEQFEFFSVIYSADVCVSFFLKKDREAADWGTTCTYRNENETAHWETSLLIRT
jgi:hypothetical protein